MNRPYIICHMLTSIDGKVTGDFLSRPECEAATEIYYEMNREYGQNGGGGFICGRITMEQSFTGGWYPDLSGYEPLKPDSVSSNVWLGEKVLSGFYAIAFDPKGRLGWRSAFLEDSDPGYDKAQIVEVLTEQADGRYLAYLRELGIPYLLAGEDEIDVALALTILKERIGVDMLVLEGGSIINGHFLRADCLDALSLVQAPITAGAESKPLFTEGNAYGFELVSAEQKNGVLITKYRNQSRGGLS